MPTWERAYRHFESPAETWCLPRATDFGYRTLSGLDGWDGTGEDDVRVRQRTHRTFLNNLMACGPVISSIASLYS
ncbi:MAG: hypothetical protein H6Q33_318 [Deltaproteobacteria bacterium]|nr:hypothetical protein [Deltaproteobacteria bacterium]